MARGGLVVGGVVVAVISAAEGLNLNYQKFGSQTVAFVPDLFCNIGDTFNGTVFTYSSSAVPPPVTLNQFIEACTAIGILPQLQTVIAGLTGTALNAWNDSVPLSDTTVQAFRTAAGLTVQQSQSLFKYAASLPK